MPVSGMHINCGNEGHPEEQLESSSVSTTYLVGKLLPGGNLTKPQKNTICSSPTVADLSQRATLRSQSQTTDPWTFLCVLSSDCAPPKSLPAVVFDCNSVVVNVSLVLESILDSNKDKAAWCQQGDKAPLQRFFIL